jgi:probable F420-dependent oxidoreductase
MSLGVTFASLGSLGVGAARDVAHEAQMLGYDSFWVAETVGTEAFSTLGHVADGVPGLGLGTGVLALQLRTPPLAAMAAATLQAFHPDRDIFLGVGISSPVVAGQWHGADYSDKPIGQVREYLTLVRECLSGEVVNFQGDHYDVRKFRLAVRLGERTPKTVLGALNAQMLKLGGELADGVLLNYLPSSAVPWCIEQIRAGGNARIHAYVHACVGEWADGAEPARRDLWSYGVVGAYQAAFTRAGYGNEMTALKEAMAAKDREAAVAAISDRMVMDIDTIGDADHVARFTQAYRDAGVDDAVMMIMPWGPDRRVVVSNTLRAVAPAAP